MVSTKYLFLKNMLLSLKKFHKINNKHTLLGRNLCK